MTSPESRLTLVELFAGIGGFSCAFEKAGVQTVAAVEIDPAARRVFANNFPEAILFDDVTKVSGDDIRSAGFVSERGILTAGWLAALRNIHIPLRKIDQQHS